MSTPNNRIILPSRRGGAYLSLFRDATGRCSIEVARDDGDEVAFGVNEHDFARLRTWLNTGISPSSIDLVDPLPPVVMERRKATLDPKPRDLTTATEGGNHDEKGA